MLKVHPEGMTENEFAEIYDIFWGKLYAIAYNYFRDKTMAQELVQDVFVNLWLKRAQLSNINDLGAYLFRCMKNRIYDQFDTLASREKLIRNATHSFSEEINITEETVQYEETLALLNAELARLPDTTRAIFKLSRFDRYTNEEIARHMHLSAKAVEYHITSALKKLRPRFSNIISLVIAVLFC